MFIGNVDDDEDAVSIVGNGGHSIVFDFWSNLQHSGATLAELTTI